MKSKQTLYAKLEIDDTLYVFLHAEQVYRNFSLCNNKLGYFSHEIAERTVSDIYNYIHDNTSGINSIVIDCAEAEEAHNVAEWIEKIIDFCKEQNKSLVFCRMSERLYGDAKIHKNGLSENKNDNKTYNVFNCGCLNNSITDDEIYVKYQNQNASILESNPNNFFVIERTGEASYSHSSNVQLPRYINVKAYIEQKDILFLGLYLLCKKAISKKLIDGLTVGEKRPLLFFNSIAGSYLASVFSKLACVDMVFLNHLGPKKKLYHELHKEQLLADRDYLIISDVVCLGAEVERAKTLIEHAGGNLKGILSVVLVEVVSERPKIESEIEKVALLTLKKGYNPIDYQIITDFPEIKSDIK